MRCNMATDNKEKKISSKKRLWGFVGVFAIALAAIIVTAVIQSFNIQSFMWVYQLAVLAAAGVGVYLVLRKTFYEYAYTFSRDHFLIHQYVGSRDTVLFAVDFEDIMALGPVSELKMEPEKIKRLEKFYLAETNLDVYYLKYRDINKDCDKILTFKPSEAVIKALSEKIS